MMDKKNEWDGGTLGSDLTEEELMQFMRDYGICKIRDLTYAANAHDAVRVVRCKDCKYYQKVYGGVPLGEVGHCICHSFETVPDWYCADGERVDE